jgi:hypothetical protein
MTRNKKIKPITMTTFIALLIILFSTSAVAHVSVPVAEANKLAEENLRVSAFPKVARASDTALKISWHKVSIASGYEVFRYDSKAKKYKKAKTINRNGVANWTDKKLKTGKKYSYKIRAYVSEGLGKRYSTFSYAISAVPYRKDSKIVNASSTLGGPSTMEIGLKQVLKMNAAVKPSKLSRAKKKAVIDSKVRTIVDEAALVKPYGSDSIVGDKVGTTNVYALAHNGNVKKIIVKVVDYAKPTSWMNLDRLGEAGDVITNQTDDLVAVFSYFSQHNDQDGTFYLGEDGKLVNENELAISEIEEVLIRLLSNSPLQWTNFHVRNDYLKLELRGYTPFSLYTYFIVFDIQNDPIESLMTHVDDSGIKVAKHWYVQLWPPMG